MAKAIAVDDSKNQNLERLKGGPERLMDFLRDVRSEMRKVITPSRAEVQSMTTVVLVTVFVFAAFFAIVDYGIGHGMEWLLHKTTGQ